MPNRMSSYDRKVMETASLCNCQKRVIVCILKNIEGRILSCGSNHCDPPDGICQRLNMKQSKDKYTGNECRTIHAEIAALKAMPKGAKPFRAIVYGHDFICKECEKALLEAGVEAFKIIPSSDYTGLRSKMSK